jgi:hypothetical protein
MAEEVANDVRVSREDIRDVSDLSDVPVDQGALVDRPCTAALTRYHWSAERFISDDRSTRCFPEASRAEACTLRVLLPPSVDYATWCTGRERRQTRVESRECVLLQSRLRADMRPVAGSNGFYFAPGDTGCAQVMTSSEAMNFPEGSVGVLECRAVVTATNPTGAACTRGPTGSSCAMEPPSACAWGDREACLRDRPYAFRSGARECASDLCISHRYSVPDAAVFNSTGHCTCRCAYAASDLESVATEPLCTCPSGFVCISGLARGGFEDYRAGFCVRVGD